MPMGATLNGGILSEPSRCSPHRFTDANPMPTKKRSQKLRQWGLKSEIKKKFAVLLFFHRRTKHYLTSLNILNSPKVAAAIKVWLEQTIKN
jgi:hypothetical protein